MQGVSAIPYTLKQHRLFEAAAHDAAVARRTGIPQATARRMAGEGVKRMCSGGLAALEAEPVHAGVGGLINKLARPIQRLLAHPSFTTEAASTESLTPEQARARLLLARQRALADGLKQAELPFEHGQGAWLGDDGMQYNDLFMQRLPRRLGRLDRDKDAIRYAGTMGQLLEQHAVPLARGVPGLVDTPEGANALIASKVTNDKLREIAKALGSDAVVAHQPGGDALIFPPKGSGDITEEEIEALRRRIQALAPDLRYGVSDSGVDRLTVGDAPLPEGWNEIGYASLGANPRTRRYAEFEKKILASPSAVDSFRNLTDPRRY